MVESGFWRMRKRTETLRAEDFTFQPSDVPNLEDGQVLVRTSFISLDPYLARAMRTWSGERPGWSEGVIHGRMVGEVIETKAVEITPGQMVLGVGRWQAVQAFDARDVEVVPAQVDPPRLALGVLGRSGLTGWVGLELSGAAAGETILVSAATGPVGSVVGQLAKSRGLRVLGMAGGEEKCHFAVQSLGFEACLDRLSPDLDEKLAEAAVEGIDILFENVGLPSIDAALPLMNQGGRITLCGLAAHYNNELPVTLRHFKALLYRSLSLRGFATAEHSDMFPRALEELACGVRDGTIRHFETITDGLENAPDAYLAMLGGAGIGKRLVEI